MLRPLLIAGNIAAPLVFAVTWFNPFALGAMFAVHMLTLYATLVPGCRWWGPVRTHCDSSEVWITIDDGPDGEHTRRAMALLEERGARATFFVIGEKVRADPELVREIAARGHGLGNHTATHPATSFWRLGPGALRREIEGGSQALQETVGEEPALFRAPAGMRNFFVHPILKRLGLELVAWSTRGFDGRCSDVDKVVARIERGLAPGAIILLHEGRRIEDGGSLLMEVLPRVLAAIEAKGLSLRS